MSEQMTAKQFRETVKAPKPSKYRNRQTVVDGIRFDSAKEARRYGELKAAETAGLISDLELQPEFLLEIGGRPVLQKSRGYPNGRRVKYVADFRYTRDGIAVIEDVKGMKTPLYKLKKAVVEAIYGIKIQEV